MSKPAVLDASAVLAVLYREQGSQLIAEYLLNGGALSSINLAEVLSKQDELGVPAGVTVSHIELLGVRIHDFNSEAAVRVGALRSLTKSAGLSLGDRACLALGQQLGAPVLTADRVWGQLDLPVEVIVIR